jgi:hypothetical protein
MTEKDCAHPVVRDLWHPFTGVVRFTIYGNKGMGFRIETAACHGYDSRHICH